MSSRFKKMLLKSLYAISVGTLLSAPAAMAQADWQGIYGTTPGQDAAARGGVLHFADGSAVAVGETRNTDNDIYVLHYSGTYCWGTDWQRTYNIGGNDVARKIRRTSDGGYVIVGTTDNTRNECSGSPRNDIFILKITSTGVVQWVRTYGDGLSDEGWDIQQLPDGGYIVAGSTRNYGSGNNDAYLLKLLADGSISWGRCYGGVNDDYFLSCEVMANGEVLAAGGTNSNTFGGTDYYVVRVTTPLGNPVAGYPANYGSTQNEGAARAIELADGTIAIAGYTRSFGGNSEGYILRTSAAGLVTNGHYYGGGANNGWDEFRDITQLSGGNLMVTGLFFNPTGGLGGNYDVYVGRIDLATLNPVSQLVFGGTQEDQGWAITRSGSGNPDGWMVAGLTRSYYAGAPSYLYVISRPNMALLNCNDRIPTITHASQLLTRNTQQQATLFWYRYCPTPVDAVIANDWIYFCGECQAGKAVEKGKGKIADYRGLQGIIAPALDSANLSVSSVDAGSDASAALYPNPVRSGNSFTIAVPAGSKAARITVTDMAGTVVYTGTATGTEISVDTDGWSSGAYAIRLSRGNESVTRQIVVTD